MYSIVIDLGGTVIKTGLVQDGKIIDFYSFERLISSLRGIMSNLCYVEDAIDTLLYENNILPSQLSGIGLAFPGIVNPVDNIIVATNLKYDDAKDMDFPACVRSRWETSCYIDNDARAATLGEWQYGAGCG